MTVSQLIRFEMEFVVCVQRFREHVLPNIEQLTSAEHVRSVHESGADLRTHLINACECLAVGFLLHRFGFNTAKQYIYIYMDVDAEDPLFPCVVVILCNK